MRDEGIYVNPSNRVKFNRSHQNNWSAGFSLHCCCYTWILPSVPLFLRCFTALCDLPSPQPFFIFINTLCYQYTLDQLSETLTITSDTSQTDDAGPVHPIFYSLCSSSYAWPQSCQFTSSPHHDCRKSSVVWQEAASRPAVSHLLTQTVWQISLPIKPSHLPHAADGESGHPFKTLHWSNQYAEICPLSLAQYGL